jgi:hypothetical protein
VTKALSSSTTYVAKFVTPVVLVGALGMVFHRSLQVRQGPPPSLGAFLFSPAFWLLLFCGVVVGYLFWFFIGRLKFVRMGERYLSVSSGFREIQVPLAQVLDVTESTWSQYHEVTIHLQEPTAFGDEIVFIPTLFFPWYGASHPVVSEIKNAARQAKESRATV